MKKKHTAQQAAKSANANSAYDEKSSFQKLEQARATDNEESFNAIRNDIMMANGGLVRSLARKACRYYGYLGLPTTCTTPGGEAVFSEEDFMQDGYILLAKAIDKFDIGAGNKFSTYATPVVGRGLNQVFNARALRRRSPRAIISLDAEVDDEKGLAKLRDHIPDANAENAFNEFVLRDLGKVLKEAILTLSERERKVVLMSQGFQCKKRKQAEIAKSLGVTPQRVTQILKGALLKLRAHPAIRELRPAS